MTLRSIGATPSRRKAGSVQTPSGRRRRVDRRAARTRPSTRARCRASADDARRSSTAGTPAVRESFEHGVGGGVRCAPVASRTRRRARSIDTPPLSAIARSSASSPGMPLLGARTPDEGGVPALRADDERCAERQARDSDAGLPTSVPKVSNPSATPRSDRDERQPAHELRRRGRLGERDPDVVGRLLRVAQGRPTARADSRRAAHPPRSRPARRPTRRAMRSGGCGRRSRPTDPRRTARPAPGVGDRGRERHPRRPRRHPGRLDVAGVGEVGPRAGRCDTGLQQHRQPQHGLGDRRRLHGAGHASSSISRRPRLPITGRPAAASMPRRRRRGACDVQHAADGAGDLTRQRPVVQAGERAERLEPGGHVVQAVGVQRAGAAVVAGVQRREQFAHLFTAALPHDEPVGTHPQRLADQPREPDRARALEVRLPRLEPDVMRMVAAAARRHPRS